MLQLIYVGEVQLSNLSGQPIIFIPFPVQVLSGWTMWLALAQRGLCWTAPAWDLVCTTATTQRTFLSSAQVGVVIMNGAVLFAHGWDLLQLSEMIG